MKIEKSKENRKKNQCKKCKLKNFISILYSSVFQSSVLSSLQVQSIQSINTINMSFTTRRNSGVRAGTVNPFCKVCYDAGLSTEEFTSHFVKDQPGPDGRVVCPTLLAQKCLICGVPGHTSSYCPDNSSVSSSSTVQKETPRYALATDDIRHPPHSIRLPPIQKQAQQQQLYRPAPRIVYANEFPPKNPVDARRDFPSLPNLSSLRRFENDEPQLKREMPVAAASPVHSPLASQTKVKYNKKSNPFGALDNNVDSDYDSDHETLLPPVVQKQENKQENLPSSSSSSWASIAAAAGSKSTVTASSKQPQQQQRARSRFSIVVPTAISAAPLPLLPPMTFKPKPVSASDLEKKKQVKKLWGDTDSEDDEEFLKRGIIANQQ